MSRFLSCGAFAAIFLAVDLGATPSNTMAAAEKWAAGLGNLAYAIDDQTAIKVVDGVVKVISEGTWVRFSA